MNAYFESLRRTNNVRKSQLFLVDDKAALPASELLQQLHNSSSDVSSSSDQGPARTVSCASKNTHTLASRYSFDLEDQGNAGIIEDLSSSAWRLDMSERSIGSPQGDQESMILSNSKASKKKSDQQ